MDASIIFLVPQTKEEGFSEKEKSERRTVGPHKIQVSN